jgi:battenin
VLPFVIPLAYRFLLPRPAVFATLNNNVDDVPPVSPVLAYAPISTVDHDDGEEEDGHEEERNDGLRMREVEREKGFALSAADKWRLVRPLLGKYMVPLCESVFCLLFSKVRLVDLLV